MTSGNTHIIHRVNLEIDVADVRLANRVKDDALRLLHNEILPKLEKYMDRLELHDEHFQLNQLNINLYNLKEENFEKEFSDLIFKVFHEKIENILDSSVVPIVRTNKEEARENNREQFLEEKVSKYTNEQLTLESFLFFLETGKLPWWGAKSGNYLDEHVLSEVLKNSSQKLLAVQNNSLTEFQLKLISLLNKNPTAFERLIHQYSFEFIFQLILAPEKVHQEPGVDGQLQKIILLLQSLVKKINSTGSTLTAQFLATIKSNIVQLISTKGVFSTIQLSDTLDELSAKIASSDSIDLLDLQSLFDEIQVEVTLSELNDQKSSLLQETKKASETTEEKYVTKPLRRADVEEGIYLNNAGLVLLHPFFESFLNDFDLLTEGQFKNSKSQTLAVHLIHYLATKEEYAAEYELGMEKFLCGWDIDLPIAREVTISEAMKDESETLLLAAIKHWSALKSTSPDGLREGFLQREGKLILNNFQNRLILENKAQDVLLSYLPWSYSIIKLPWMSDILFTEWS